MTVSVRKILIVEDDAHLSKFLSRELGTRGFCSNISPCGKAAYSEVQDSDYDLVILDLNLPDMDGMELLKDLRSIHSQLPILVLTARNRTEDLVLGLDQGANDFLMKPFSFLELLARVRSLLRVGVKNAPNISRLGELKVLPDEHSVLRGERRIDLTPREFTILEYLMSNIGKVVSRQKLMEDVWNVPFDSTTNIVDVYMKYLRDKIDTQGETKLIKTVRGVGYVLSNA